MHQDEFADLRTRLAGLRIFLHARRLLHARGLRAMAAGAPRPDEIVKPILAEIAALKARLRSLGA